MNRFTRMLSTAAVVAALTASLPATAPAATADPLAVAFAAASTPMLASHNANATDLLARRRNSRSACVRWWTCGPFKRERPRFA